MTLPDFLLMGAPKAGTTALHVALARHPELCTSTVKEPEYFGGGVEKKSQRSTQPPSTLMI